MPSFIELLLLNSRIIAVAINAGENFKVLFNRRKLNNQGVSDHGRCLQKIIERNR